MLGKVVYVFLQADKIEVLRSIKDCPHLIKLVNSLTAPASVAPSTNFALCLCEFKVNCSRFADSAEMARKRVWRGGQENGTFNITWECREVYGDVNSWYCLIASSKIIHAAIYEHVSILTLVKTMFFVYASCQKAIRWSRYSLYQRESIKCCWRLAHNP